MLDKQYIAGDIDYTIISKANLIMYHPLSILDRVLSHYNTSPLYVAINIE